MPTVTAVGVPSETTISERLSFVLEFDVSEMGMPDLETTSSGLEEDSIEFSVTPASVWGQ